MTPVSDGNAHITRSPGRLTLTHARRPLGGLLASYRVYVDGKRAGRLGRGKTRSFQLPPGQHLVKLKILYCDSGDFLVRLAPDEAVTLICQARPYGGRTDVIGHRHEWIKIHEAERRLGGA